jgi:hypothetical protein
VGQVSAHPVILEALSDSDLGTVNMMIRSFGDPSDLASITKCSAGLTVQLPCAPTTCHLTSKEQVTVTRLSGNELAKNELAKNKTAKLYHCSFMW